MDPRRALAAFTKQWLELDDAIAQRRKELRALVDQQKDTTMQVETLMSKLNIKDVGLGQNNAQGVLRQKVSQTYVPITRAHVESVLSKFIRNEDQVQTLVRAIFQEERPRTERYVLKRCKK